MAIEYNLELGDFLELHRDVGMSRHALEEIFEHYKDNQSFYGGGAISWHTIRHGWVAFDSIYALVEHYSDDFSDLFNELASNFDELGNEDPTCLNEVSEDYLIELARITLIGGPLNTLLTFCNGSRRLGVVVEV